MALKDFVSAYHNWALTGRSTIKFNPNVGMCSNIYPFIEWKHPTYTVDQVHKRVDALVTELIAAIADGMPIDYAYPFGKGDYQQRQSDGTQHECPNRRNWCAGFLRRVK